MSIITRAKNILLSPRTEWDVIQTETETPQSLLGKYVIPMAFIPAVASFIGFGLIGLDAVVVRVHGIRWGLTIAVIKFIASVISYYICAYVVDALAPSFGSEKNLGRSAQLVAYSFTAAWVAGIFYIIPSLNILTIVGLYSIYLFYMGIPPMKHTPEDKRIGYIVVSILVSIVISFLVSLVITRIVYAITGDPFLTPGNIPDININLH